MLQISSYWLFILASQPRRKIVFCNLRTLAGYQEPAPGSRFDSNEARRAGTGSTNLSEPGVQFVPEPVPEEVEGHDRQQNCQTGKSGNPPRRIEIVPAIGDHHPPSRDRGGDSGTEET